MSILIEHYAGNFPFWLAPVQISVLPITDALNDIASALAERLKSLNYRVHFDGRSEKVQRKIAESEQKKIPYCLIIGKREAENGQVALRKHGEGDKGAMAIQEVLEMFARESQV